MTGSGKLAFGAVRRAAASTQSHADRLFLLARQAFWKIRADRSLAPAIEAIRERTASRLQARTEPFRAEYARRMRTGDYENAVALIDGLPETESDARDDANRASRWLLKVDALVKDGRCDEGYDALQTVETKFGVSSVTRGKAALIHSFAGRFEECVAASTEAILATPRDQQRSPRWRTLHHLRAEALCSLDRCDDAFASLVSSLKGARPTNADIVALRRTVRTPGATEAFFRFLLPWLSSPGQLPSVGLFNLSVAYRDNAMMRSAIFAVRQRFLDGERQARFGSKPSSPRNNWTQDAAKALLDLRRDLDGLGLEFFLVSGTLLGCVREGGIIGHDKDLDVGVFTEIAPAELRVRLSRTGRFKVRPLLTDKLVQVQHANGVLLDVFIHWREGDLIWHEGQKARWWNSPFDLEETSFLGGVFKVPASADRYLTENYGQGWRTPEPNFETFVDTPNMIVADTEHMEWYFYAKLFDYHVSGKAIQFAKVWAALQALTEPDAMVQAAASRVLDSIAARSPE